MWYTKYIEQSNAWCTRLFHAIPMAQSPWLPVVFYTLLLDSVLVFSAWRSAGILSTSLVTDGTLVCWPYLRSCDVFHVFNDMPFSYSLGLLYTALGALVFFGAYAGITRRWGLALGLLSVLTLYRFFVVYVASYNVPTNYNALAIFVGVVLLFSRDKVFGLKVLLTVFYYVTLLYRIHPGYLTGDTFTSLKLGLPLVPDMLTPYVGILLIVLLLVSPTLLWVQHASLRLCGLVSLTAFHTLTIALVGYIYPLLSLPLLFFAYHTHETFSVRRVFRSTLLTTLLLCMILGQLIPLFIQGDHRITGEGTKFGFYMFEANHQCSGYLEQTKRDGTKTLIPYSIGSGMGICDPYVLWFKAQSLCSDPHTAVVAGYFIHSINGKPYVKVIDEVDMCVRTYTLFRHNEWIREGSALPFAPPKNSLLPNAL